MTSKKFEDIFNECLERMLSGSETAEQCAGRYPEHARELESLLRTAAAVSEAVSISPGAEVRSRVRYQLQLKMAKEARPKRGVSFGWRPRWAVAVMSVLLVLVLGGSTVLAADSSMPGSPLYPVKIATENVRVKLAGTETEKAELYTALAERRVDEINRLMDSGKGTPAQVEAVSKRYVESVILISGLPALAGDDSVQPARLAPPAAAETVPAVAARELPGKENGKDREEPQLAITAAAPESAPAPAVAGDAGDASRRASDAKQHGEVGPTTTRSRGDDDDKARKDELSREQIARLKKLINYQAVTHPQQLEKWLDREDIPEKYKPAIRRMVQEARQTYQETLKNLESKEARAGAREKAGKEDDEDD